MGVETGMSGLTQRLWALLSGVGLTPTAPSADPLAALIREHRHRHPKADLGALRRAYEIAEGAHRGQVRKSGEPYITHPVAVARILAVLGMDTTTLVAALLHDTVEDTDYGLAELDRDFGTEVALLVDGVTKFEKVSYGDRLAFGEHAEAETIRKMIVAAGRDVRVLIIKLADRVHNMQTLSARSPASRTRISRNTHDYLIPLCDRLGIQALKRELEDAVLYHLEPEAYARIHEYVQRRPLWTEYLAGVIVATRSALRRHKVTAQVLPRPRHYYSVWKDTIAGGAREPLELPRILIQVDGPDTDCYAALGAIHGAWRPVPGRFKDFIACPKNNLYRSLHTTVIGPDDRSVEVLIRTEAMHRRAEYGIIANFRFPDFAAEAAGGSSADPGVSHHGGELDWLRRLLEWQQEAADPGQFLEVLHFDLAAGQVQVFTRNGRPVLLPAGATPVDFAYVLDTHLGARCIAATINGRLVPLSSALQDGDVVEILINSDDPYLDDGYYSEHYLDEDVREPSADEARLTGSRATEPHAAGPPATGSRAAGPGATASGPPAARATGTAGTDPVPADQPRSAPASPDAGAGAGTVGNPGASAAPQASPAFQVPSRASSAPQAGTASQASQAPAADPVPLAGTHGPSAYTDAAPDDDGTLVGPDREWLEFVKTPHAQLQISRWFNHDHRELPADEGERPPTVAHQVRLGRAAIGLALRQRDRGLVSDVPLVRLAFQLGYPDLESLLVAVAAHTVSAEQVVEELIASVDHGPD
ncbi:MAG TPA: HD domain-containing protein [Micromonosporaceae bacterium]|nr:HD domain-containing protein [Micromonosporaceae bacterium]